jgi:hypothetical protein
VEKEDPLPEIKAVRTFDKLDDQAQEQVKVLFSEIGNGRYAEAVSKRR